MLDRDVVLEIRKRYDLGYPTSEIAEGYRVSETTVRNIGKRRTHKRVKAGSVEPYRYQKAPQHDEGAEAIHGGPKSQRAMARSRRNQHR